MEKIWLKNYPPHVPQDLPPLEKDIIDQFNTACEEFKHKPAFISFDKSFSYKEMKKKSFELAGFLQSQGCKKGDVIAIQLPNIIQQPLSLWAGLLSGLTLVNLNPLYTLAEMLAPLKETKAKGLILLSHKAPALKSLWDQTPLQFIIMTNPGDMLDFPKKQIINTLFKGQNWRSSFFSRLFAPKGPKLFSFKPALREGAKTKVQIKKRERGETLFIQYTGGTTGRAKGACLSHKNILSNIKQCELWMSGHLERGQEQTLAALPLYHIFALLVNGFVFFLNGFANILIANPRRISSLVKTLKKHKLSSGTGLNSLFKALLAHKQFKNIDFSGWKFFISGGMALDSSVQKLWQSATSSYLVEGYGLTEASPIISCNRLDKGSEGFAGFPFPSTEIRIRDEKGKELGVGEEGELEARGPQIMEKYYNQKEETKKVLSKEGWLKTGDIAKINSQGLIQIIDRKKDMINISGLKVYPVELEERLLSFNKVKEALVTSGRGAGGEEIVQAFIVKKTEDLSAKELISYCKKYLAPYKRPKQITFVKEIPKSALGKPLRRMLKPKI